MRRVRARWWASVGWGAPRPPERAAGRPGREGPATPAGLRGAAGDVLPVGGVIIGDRAPVAQRIEQVPSKHLVAGSSPAGRAVTGPTWGSRPRCHRRAASSPDPARSRVRPWRRLRGRPSAGGAAVRVRHRPPHGADRDGRQAVGVVGPVCGECGDPQLPSVACDAMTVSGSGLGDMAARPALQRTRNGIAVRPPTSIAPASVGLPRSPSDTSTVVGEQMTAGTTAARDRGHPAPPRLDGTPQSEKGCLDRSRLPRPLCPAAFPRIPENPRCSIHAA